MRHRRGEGWKEEDDVARRVGGGAGPAFVEEEAMAAECRAPWRSVALTREEGTTAEVTRVMREKVA